jgi:hypothetical protein
MLNCLIAVRVGYQIISIWLCEYMSQLILQEGGEDGTVCVCLCETVEHVYTLYRLHNSLQL